MTKYEAEIALLNATVLLRQYAWSLQHLRGVPAILDLYDEILNIAGYVDQVAECNLKENKKVKAVVRKTRVEKKQLL